MRAGKARLRNSWRLLTLGLTLGLLLGVSQPQVALAASGGCTAPSTDYGTVTTTVTVKAGTAAATYHVWTRMVTLDTDTQSNSYMLEVDGATTNCYTVGTSPSKTVQTYTAAQDASNTRFSTDPNDSSDWIETDVTSTVATPVLANVNLPAATTSDVNVPVKLIGTGPDVVLDRLLFVQDNCVPTGTGDNCLAATDTGPPVGSITSPAAGAVASPTITVAASDDTSVAGVDVYDGATKLGCAKLNGTSCTTQAQSGNWTYAWDTSALTVGSSHTLSAVITDSSGKTTTTTSVVVTIKDAAPPTNATVTSPTASSTVNGNISLAATAQDNVAPTKFVFTITGPTNKTVTVNSGSPASTTLDTTTLTNGSYTVSVVASDAAGNNSTASPTVSFTVNNVAGGGDTTAPTVTSVSLANNAVVSTDLANLTGGGAPYNSNAYSVSVVAADNTGGSGLKQVSVQLNNGTPQILTTGFTFAINMSALAMNGPTCTTTTPYTLKVIATDNANNNSTTTTVNFYATKAADMNDDCHSDFHDLSTLSGKYGQTGSSLGRADTNHDNIVDFHDLSALAGQYGKF